MKLRNITTAILFLFLTGSIDAKDSTFSKNTIQYGIGLGISDGYQHTGLGYGITSGYERNLWRERLRLNIAFTYGLFSSIGINDVGEQYFSVLTLESGVKFDLLRYKAVSLVVGMGVCVNRVFGLKSYHDYYLNYRHRYFGEVNGALIPSVGIRINPKKSAVVYEFTPINFYIGTHEFFQEYLRFGIGIKLR